MHQWVLAQNQNHHDPTTVKPRPMVVVHMHCQVAVFLATNGARSLVGREVQKFSSASYFSMRTFVYFSNSCPIHVGKVTGHFTNQLIGGTYHI